MASSVVDGQADLDSLIFISRQLSDVLDQPTPALPRVPYHHPAPPDLQYPIDRTISLATKQLRMASFSNLNGSKLHTFSQKTAPYPLSYDGAVLDSDICDRITLRKLCQNGMTLYTFPNGPPDSILDVGCGSGDWILEAASHWKSASRLVGMDLVPIQPVLTANGLLSSSHDRIQWVHGNVLAELPFADASFDFVRICKIALGVPENKWNHLLEEVVRVLKPRGILELLEEDIIFPCRPSVDDSAPAFERAQSSVAGSFSINGDHESSGSSGDHSTRTFPTTSNRRPLSILVPKTLNPRTRSRSLGASANNATANLPYSRAMYSHPSTSTFSVNSSEWMSVLPTLSASEAISEANALGIPLRDPRDHTVLRQTWVSMLDQRFVSSKPTTLLAFYLPFHLNSVLSHEPLQILAPPPSYNGCRREPSPLSKDNDLYEIKLSTIDAAPSFTSRNSTVFTTKDAAMHLRRVLQVILACAEALWEQVQKKYPDMPREYFDILLRDFELDMLDRIDTRSILRSGFGWDSQMGTSDLRKWRERVAAVSPPPYRDESPMACRVIRGFVAVKGSS